MLVKYIRDDFGKPFATIVATNGEVGIKIGTSICSYKDRFNKKRGLQIASNRANKGGIAGIYDGKIKNSRKKYFFMRDCGIGHSKFQYVYDIMNYEIERMKDRAKRYYKPKIIYSDNK